MNNRKWLILALLLGQLSAAYASSASSTSSSQDLDTTAPAKVSCKKDIINGIYVRLCQGDKFYPEQINNLLRMAKECFEDEMGQEFLSLPSGIKSVTQNLQATESKSTRFWIENASDSKIQAFLTVDKEHNFEGFKDKWGDEISLSSVPRIRGVCVTRDYREKKLGQALFNFTMKSLPEILRPLPHSIFLTVFANKASAIHIYNKFGFKKVGKMSELYFNPPDYRTSQQEPFLLMWRKLSGELGFELNGKAHIKGAL